MVNYTKRSGKRSGREGGFPGLVVHVPNTGSTGERSSCLLVSGKQREYR